MKTSLTAFGTTSAAFLPFTACLLPAWAAPTGERSANCILLPAMRVEDMQRDQRGLQGAATWPMGVAIACIFALQRRNRVSRRLGQKQQPYACSPLLHYFLHLHNCCGRLERPKCTTFCLNSSNRTPSCLATPKAAKHPPPTCCQQHDRSLGSVPKPAGVPASEAQGPDCAVLLPGHFQRLCRARGLLNCLHGNVQAGPAGRTRKGQRAVSLLLGLWRVTGV